MSQAGKKVLHRCFLIALKHLHLFFEAKQEKTKHFLSSFLSLAFFANSRTTGSSKILGPHDDDDDDDDALKFEAGYLGVECKLLLLRQSSSFRAAWIALLQGRLSS